jgi:hypothetical protein
VSTVRSFPTLRRLLEDSAPKVQRYLLYLHAAQGDKLLRDFVSDFILGAFYSGHVDLTLEDSVNWLKKALKRANLTWNEAVTTKAAHSILALLRDAGLLEGIQHKSIRFPYLPIEVATYLVYHLRAEGFTTGKRILEHPDWQLFLLQTRGVDEVMARVAEAGLISWAAAGSVYRLDFPYDSLEEVAHALVH